MQISGEYGTELLLRYTEEQRAQELERRRVINERLAETRAAQRLTHVPFLARLAAVFGSDGARMPRRSEQRASGGSQVHAAHR